MPNLRKSHAGKSSNEKEAYKDFLTQRFRLDKTAEDDQNTSKTDASAFENDDIVDQKPRGKSWRLRIKDFLANNWVITILGGIILAAVLKGFSLIVDQRVQGQQITGIEGRVGKVEDKVDDLGKTVNAMGNNLDTFKVGVDKDLEYIKVRVAQPK